MTVRTPAQVATDVTLRIRELRRLANLTQQALAERLDITVQYLRRVESGGVNLSIQSLARFARALGVEPTALLVLPRDRSRSKRGRPAKAKATGQTVGRSTKAAPKKR
jgi:transcriptional regulator with XRE-family HTH domain